MTEQEFRAQVLNRLLSIEETQEEILIAQAHIKANQDSIQLNQKTVVEQVKEVNIILHGSEKLGVPPLHKQVRELYQFYDRAKWALGALGVTNIGFIIVWIFNQLQSAMRITP